MAAVNAFGTLLEFGDEATPTEVWTTIANVGDIDGPEISSELEDVSSHTSEGGFAEEIPVGFVSLGEITFEITYNPTDETHDATDGLIADAVAKNKRHMRITWPDEDETTWTGYAYVLKFKVKAPVKGALRADVTLKPSGAWTFA